MVTFAHIAGGVVLALCGTALLRFAVGKFPAVHGPHKRLGARRLRVGEFAQGPLVHLVYPTEAADGPRLEYTTPTSAGGIGATLKSRVVEWLMWALFSYQQHPDIAGAPLLPAERTAEGKGMPLVVFSHGLHGTCDMYLQLCREVASFGAVVVSINHEDGTSSYDPQRVPYRSPPSTLNYSRKEEVVEFRRRFLAHREEEVDAVLAHLKAMDELKGVVDFSRVVLAGHSFGAASALNYGSKRAGDTSILGYLLYDIWMHPLPEDVHVHRPALSVQSETFAHPSNNESTERAERLGHEGDVHSFYIPGTTHALWCDYAVLLPRFVNPLSKFRSPVAHHASWVEATRLFLHHYAAGTPRSAAEVEGEAAAIAKLAIPETQHLVAVKPKRS